MSSASSLSGSPMWLYEWAHMTLWCIAAIWQTDPAAACSGLSSPVSATDFANIVATSLSYTIAMGVLLLTFSGFATIYSPAMICADIAAVTEVSRCAPRNVLSCLPVTTAPPKKCLRA